MSTYYVYNCIQNCMLCVHLICIDVICIYSILHVRQRHTMWTQHVFQQVLNSELHSMQSYIMQCNVMAVVVQCMCVVYRLRAHWPTSWFSRPVSSSQQEHTQKTLRLKCHQMSIISIKNIAFLLFHAFSKWPYDANLTKVMIVSASCSPPQDSKSSESSFS